MAGLIAQALNFEFRRAIFEYLPSICRQHGSKQLARILSTARAFAIRPYADQRAFFARALAVVRQKREGDEANEFAAVRESAPDAVDGSCAVPTGICPGGTTGNVVLTRLPFMPYPVRCYRRVPCR